jgi:hypothetical protein
MSIQANNPQLMATWLRATPAPHRWQALQSQISQSVATDASFWTKRSSLSCKWLAARAIASAPAIAGR